jgi:tetratricopeptide (TPR) repeat protein
MSSEDEAKSKLVKRYTRLAIVAGFLFALLWPLGSFFFWIFTGATAYFVFLAFYYRPRSEEDREEIKFEYTRPSWQKAKQPSPINVSPKNVKLIMAILVISISGLLLILMIIGFATGEENSMQQNEDITVNENRNALSEDPDNLDALTNMGNSFYSISQYDSAITYYDKVLKIDPKNSSGLYNKGLVFFQLKDYEKSKELLRKCISLYPDNTDAIMVLGDNYYSQENFNEAIVWYKQAYEKGERKSSLLNVMAYIYDVQNQKTQAIRFYKDALGQDSSLVDVYDRLAELEPGNSDMYKKKAEAWR